MQIYLLCGLGVAFAIYGVYALWPGTDDRDWELRWATLDDLDRAWLAAASRSSANRATLEERGELELAKGFGRRELRYRAKVALAMLPLVAVGAALVLTGLLSGGFAGLVFFAYTTLFNLVTYRRDRQIKHRYRETQDRYLAPAGADAASTA